MMFAVIKTGGKQYRVAAQDVLQVDRLEAEPAEFHRRVRAGFLALSRSEPSRYIVIDAARPVDDVTREIKDRIREVLPDPVPKTTEAPTGSFRAITEQR